MKEELYLTAKDGTRIYLKKSISEKDRAVLVMAHGLGEYSGSFDYCVEKLNAAGIGTYTPDHRGHGRSGGERAYLADYNQLLDDFHLTVTKAIAENPDRPVFLYGHSMGGFTVSLYSVKYHPHIRGVITSGAVVRDNARLFRDVPADMDEHERMDNTLTWQICSVEERVTEFRNDPLATLSNTAGICQRLVEGINWFYDKMPEFTYPVLMTHGSEDCIVDPKDTYEFFRRAGSRDKQMKVYGGSHHALFNEFMRDEVLDDYIAWMNRRI